METDILKSFRFLEIDPPKSRGGKGLRINQLSIKTNISKPYLSFSADLSNELIKEGIQGYAIAVNDLTGDVALVLSGQRIKPYTPLNLYSNGKKTRPSFRIRGAVVGKIARVLNIKDSERHLIELGENNSRNEGTRFHLLTLIK